jgi:hypothetical protein
MNKEPVCATCGDTTADNFYTSSKVYCKPCSKKRVKEWRHKRNPMNAEMLEYYMLNCLVKIKVSDEDKALALRAVASRIEDFIDFNS